MAARNQRSVSYAQVLNKLYEAERRTNEAREAGDTEGYNKALKDTETWGIVLNSLKSLWFPKEGK